MRATLIYNRNSGGASGTGPDDIVAALRQAGYEPDYHPTDGEGDLDAVLAAADGLVVAAGGDGTLRAVGTRLVGRGIPLAPLPLGTVNNICRTLAISGTPREIIARLREPRRCPFDVGRVLSPQGAHCFLEAFGYGLYAQALASYAPEQGKSIPRAISTAFQTLSGYHAPQCRVLLDGEDISGDYLMLEALNTASFGPLLKMAPEADPGDNLLDVVRIREGTRDGLLRYITGLVAGRLEELPSVERTRGRCLEIHGAEPFALHVDAEVLSPRGAPPPGPITLRVDVLHHALELWLPQPGTRGEKP